MRFQKFQNEVHLLKSRIHELENIKEGHETKVAQLEKELSQGQTGQHQALKDLRDTHYKVTDFYSQVLVGLSHVIHISESDKNAIHEMQSYWNKNDTSDHRVVAPGLVQRFQSGLKKALMRFKTEVEKPVREELRALQISVGLIEASAIDSKGEKLKETLSSKLFEAQRRVKEVEYELDIESRKVKALEQQIAKQQKSTETSIIATESELRTLRGVIDEEKNQRKTELRLQADRYEKKLAETKVHYHDSHIYNRH